MIQMKSLIICDTIILNIYIFSWTKSIVIWCRNHNIDTPYGNCSHDWAVVCRKEALKEPSIGI